MRQSATVTLMLVVATTLTLGCSREVRFQVTVDTTATGVQLVTNIGAGQWKATGNPPWQLQRALQIDGEGESGVTLEAVTSLVRNARGDLYALQGRVPEVLQFDSTGQLRRRLGRRGEGPGESQFPDGIGVDSESVLWIWDGGTRRVSRYDEDGAYLDMSVPLGGLKRFGCRCNGFTAHGRRVEGYRTAQAPSVLSIVLGPVAAEGTFADSVILMVDQQPVVSRTLKPRVLFAPRLLMSNPTDEGIWFAYSDSYRIAEISYAGDTIRVVERNVGQQHLTKRQLAGAAELAASTGRAVGMPTDSAPASAEFGPLIAGLAVDDAGNVWVARPGGDDGDVDRFDVFDSTGIYLGEVTPPVTVSLDRMSVPPADFSPWLVDRRGLVALKRSRDDVPSIVGFEVVRP